MMRKHSSGAFLIINLMMAACARDAIAEPTTAPTSTESSPSFDALLRNYIYGQGQSDRKWWKTEQVALADALIAIASEDRFLTETKLKSHFADSGHYGRFKGAFLSLKNLTERHRVTAKLLPLLDSSECDESELGLLGGMIIFSGGEPCLLLLEQVVAGQRKFEFRERDETTNYVLQCTRLAAEGGRFSPTESIRAFDLIRQMHPTKFDEDYRELLANIDPKRTAELLATEGFLRPDHPEHTKAISIAAEHRLSLPVRTLVEYLDQCVVSTADDQDRRNCLNVFVLLAVADPKQAEAQAVRLLQWSKDNLDIDARARRDWKVVALIGQLETRGINRCVNLDLLLQSPGISCPKSALVIARVSEMMSNLSSPDIGRYFAEITSDWATVDLAALDTIGADETCKRLQSIFDSVGTGGFSESLQERVQAVRALGDAKVIELDSSLKDTPDDLVVLIMEHQIEHAEEMKKWLDASDAAYEAKVGHEPGKLWATWYVTFERIFRDSKQTTKPTK